MPEPRRIDFSQRQWEDEAPGIRSQATTHEGSRWAFVEYGPEVAREEWCTEGHRGWVVAGEIEYEFDDGHPPVRVGAGQAFRLPGRAAPPRAHPDRRPPPPVPHRRSVRLNRPRPGRLARAPSKLI